MKNLTADTTSAVLAALEVLALSKAVPDAAVKAIRGDIPVGQHKGTVRVDIAFDLKVGEDYEQRIVAKADPWTLLAVALSKLNGVTVDAIVREAIMLPEEMAEAVKKTANDAMAAVKETTVTTCKGKVTGTVVVAKVA